MRVSSLKRSGGALALLAISASAARQPVSPHTALRLDRVGSSLALDQKGALQAQIDPTAEAALHGTGSSESSSFGDITSSLSSADRPTIFLYVATCCMGLVLAMLCVCCVYDTANKWSHRAHFHACKGKLQCVHEVLLKPTGEVHLCPICVDFLPNKGVGSSPHQVVFLCGHKFHTECANRWFLLNPGAPGRCPVCDLAHCYSGTQETWGGKSAENGEFDMSAACRSVNTANEVKSFLLRSLASQYPSIVTPAHVKRWMSCNTEIWLNELSNPKFQSIWSTTQEALREGSRGAAGAAGPASEKV